MRLSQVKDFSDGMSQYDYLYEKLYNEFCIAIGREPTNEEMKMEFEQYYFSQAEDKYESIGTN